jgi:hypothetical protein
MNTTTPDWREPEMAHDQWGNQYDEGFFDLFFVAVGIGLVVGVILTLIFTITMLTMGWPHDILKAGAISIVVPFLVVLALGNGDD